MASAHLEQPQRNADGRHTIGFSGAQLAGVSPAFSLQGTAAFLFGVISASLYFLTLSTHTLPTEEMVKGVKFPAEQV